jgi:hypothetical protein
MNRLRNLCPFWLIVLTLASGISVAALKSKPAPEFPNSGVTLDVSDWSFRKSVMISNSGPQQLELDLDVLSHAQRDFSDLRLMRQGEQIPYLIEPASTQRFITPDVVATNAPQNPTVSRWIVHLPRPHLPVAELRCESATHLFERDVILYEILHEADRGEEYQQMLARGKWTKTPAPASKKFTFTLHPPPLTDTLILETQNGDNPPIQLDRFQFVYSAPSILFEAKAGDELFLYYGNSSVSAPHYDLSLVAAQLRAVDKSAAALGSEERLNQATYRAPKASGRGGAMFWGILALVVVALLLVIARLLPKSDAQPPK